MIDSRVSPSLGVGRSRLASTEMPKKNVARIVPISSKVVAACFDSGFLNAGTPFEIASMPVRATAPEENARRNSSTVRPVSSLPPVSCVTASVFGASGSSPPVASRTNPTTINEPRARM